MYFEISVSLNGRHFFSTAERSLTDSEKFHTAIQVFQAKFTKTEGYEISAICYPGIGHVIALKTANDSKLLSDLVNNIYTNAARI